jgi:nucleoside-diphosphate-sugar epimerase
VATWVIIGAGYTGSVVAARLAAEHEVLRTHRRPREGARVADLARPETLAGLVPDGAIVVCCAPPGADPAGETTALVAVTRGARHLVYVSSTGVYAPAHGDWVDETWPIAPVTRSGKARVAAEAVLAQATPPVTILRAAGIHGPGRGLHERLRAGTYRIVGDGASHVSRIHVADLASAIIAAGERGVAGTFNAADDDPAPIGEVADAIARSLGLPPPPRVPVASVDPEVAGMLTADRRIANGRMKRELVAELRFPSWRDGV